MAIAPYNAGLANSAHSEPTMRASRFLLATLRETPADAEVISHQLMLRAGSVREGDTGL